MKNQKISCIKCTKKTENKTLPDGTKVKIVSFLANDKAYAFYKYKFPPKGKAFVEVWIFKKELEEFVKLSNIDLGG